MGSYDENDPLSLEFLGMRMVQFLLIIVFKNADLIIALGSRFDDRTTGNIEKYAPKALEAANNNKGGIVHINIDDNEFNKIVNSNINIKTDCKDFFEKLYLN